MAQLSNNCRISEISVIPKNWETSQADLSIKWIVHYRFYDDTLKKIKPVKIRHINKYLTLKTRQDAVRNLKKRLEYLYFTEGHNPITNSTNKQIELTSNDSLTLKTALQYAIGKFEAVKNYKAEVTGTFNYFLWALSELNYDYILLKQITKRHLKLILEKCGELKKLDSPPTKKNGAARKQKGEKWNNARYNAFRKQMASLFRILVDEEYLDHNIMLDVQKLKTLKKEREVITKDEFLSIIQTLGSTYPEFVRFAKIFFFSGSRTTEILALKKEMIDLKNQRFKVEVKKGADSREQWRTIPDNILSVWNKLYNETGKGQYLFSVGLKPGTRMIRSEQITRRWRRHVKEKLCITADFYSLKHLFLDLVADLHDIETAQKTAGHSTPIITMDYAINEKKRQHNRLKTIPIYI